MTKIKIEIPCDTCGCSTYNAMTKEGMKCELQVCKCEDGSGAYEVTINKLNGDVLYETHRCNKEDITDCINGRFSIDPNSISHECG